MTKVVNLYKEPYDVYIGRSGKGQDGYFGNPVKIGKTCVVCDQVHQDGGSTLSCYAKYLYLMIESDEEFRRRFFDLKGKTLGCFCHPKPCHGDVMVELLDYEDNRKRDAEESYRKMIESAHEDDEFADMGD